MPVTNAAALFCFIHPVTHQLGAQKRPNTGPKYLSILKLESTGMNMNMDINKEKRQQSWKITASYKKSLKPSGTGYKRPAQ